MPEYQMRILHHCLLHLTQTCFIILIALNMKKALILRCPKENNINTQSGFTFLGFFFKEIDNP